MQPYTGHNSTLVSYDHNTKDIAEKEVQFINTYIEDARDALQLEKLEYADFNRKIKEYCGILVSKDKSLTSDWNRKALS